LDADLSSLNIFANIEFLLGPYWSSTYVSPFSGRKSGALIFPSPGNQFIIGVVDTEYLHSHIESRWEQSDTLTIVVDEYGETVYQPSSANLDEQQSLAATTPFKDAQLGIFGTYEVMLGNTSFIGSTANIAETNWLVMIVEPLAEANKPLRNMTIFFIVAVVLSAGIVFILAVRQSKRLLKPLTDLQSNIQAVADGDYKAEISQQSHEEFEKVATLFRHMSAAIKRREKLLEINEERLVSLLEVHNLKQLAEDEMLEFVLEQAVRLTRSEIGYLHILNEEGQEVKLTLWSKNIEEFCKRYRFSKEKMNAADFGRKSIVDRKNVVRNNQKTLVDTSWDDMKFTILRQLSVPIFDGKKMVAVVGVLNKKTDYDNTDARQLSLYFNHTWDILQQKRFERDRSRLAEQLAQAQKLEAIGTLAAGIAHDFNNVLMVILGNTEMAKDNVDKPDKIKNDLEQIFKGALRARDLVNQILVFSRNNAEGLKPLDIRPIVKEAVKLLRSSMPATITIHQDIAEESFSVFADPGKINQLVMNLCTNAYQAMDGSGGELFIALQPKTLDTALHSKGKMVVPAGRYMLLVIGDSGKGIPDEMINRIFEPYFTTREKERGTGLGLAVVHGIVNGLKGAITVESELGKGSTFKVYLPIVQAETLTEDQIISGALPGGDEHILYIDDDESVALVNSRILESLGYTVSTYITSTTAFDHFYENPELYDLVITDMDMPEMSGDVLAAKILEVRHDIPIILCTGYSEKIDAHRAEELGIRELMMKPLTRLDLALTIRKILGFG
jgi:signal transduction histidine kinase/HAMP domain-containing protein